MKFALIRPFLFLAVFFTLLLSIPFGGVVGWFRGVVAMGVSPLWAAMQSADEDVRNDPIEILQLRTRLGALESALMQFMPKSGAELLVARGEAEMGAVPAQVVFRGASPWNHSIWIGAGEKDNRLLGKEVVAENSPVVVGDVVIGVVEEVKEKRARVRLITDPLFTPSVRAVRGGLGEALLVERIDALLEVLGYHEEKMGASEIASALVSFKRQADLEQGNLHLAKGELAGVVPTIRRTFSTTIRGVGFNYDFSDEKGSARDLRTGQVMGSVERAPLIKVGDLLITTGLDGVFPEGLRVGIVSKIYPLHEGGCSYDLEADYLLTDFSSVSQVFVLPPQ